MSKASDASGDGCVRIDDPQPAAAPRPMARSGAAVGEGQVRAEVEGDLSTVGGELPRFGQRGPELEVGVERGQRLEQLGA